MVLQGERHERGSREDRKYRARAQSVAASKEFGSPEEFLRSLRMEAVLSVDDVSLLARSTQLTQKTNQFNLTLKRYTEAAMGRVLNDRSWTVIAATLKDRFTDHGWIALAILEQRQADACWELDNFMMSCRVIGRSFEDAFLAACLDHVRRGSRETIGPPSTPDHGTRWRAGIRAGGVPRPG